MALDYLLIAKAIASASKDPKYQVSAVIIDAAGNIRSTGYNGAPRGVTDFSFRYMKPAKQFYIAHAEENAIVQAARNGIATDGCSMLILGKAPCATCARMIIQAGIKSVQCQRPNEGSNYAASFEVAKIMFMEAKIEVGYLNDNEEKDNDRLPKV